MTLRSLLDAYAAHVADEHAQADRALREANATDKPAERHALIDARHDAQTRARVWQQAHDLALPHARFPEQAVHVPGRIRLGSPGDGEPGDGE